MKKTKKMNNFKRRALIFVTFFGSCLAISLLSAALGTNHWITAQCKRTENTDKSNGTVNMGLFVYEANLNFGLGDRPYEANMLGKFCRKKKYYSGIQIKKYTFKTL